MPHKWTSDLKFPLFFLFCASLSSIVWGKNNFEENDCEEKNLSNHKFKFHTQEIQ